MSSSLLEPPNSDEPSMARGASNSGSTDGSERGRSPVMHSAHLEHLRSSSRTPTSAEIDAVIAAAMANAPPPIPIQPEFTENINRSATPLMTNLLPAAVGLDGRVNLFVGNLPYRVRWQDLKDLFRKAGTVLRADVSLGPDNRSRGYGTVLMGSREDAARAIDRYNGYTWQTRTLEVRPDRLPPEYEPQNHAPHPPPHRPAVFPFHSSGHSPYPMAGHLTPQNGWQGQGRPPFPQGAGHSGSHGMFIPGLGPNPTAHPMTMSGSSPIPPIPSAQSPSAMYGTLSLPLSVQNTGGQAQPYPQLAASPLAGSLSSGLTQPTGPGNYIPRLDSSTPLSHTASPDPSIPVPRTTSPTPGGSRPTSSQEKAPTSISPARGDSGLGRAPPPGNLGALPPPPFAGASAVVSPTESSQGVAPGVEALGSSPPALPRVPGASVPQLEGLSHQGMGLGPPNTLHDRVIFVSNLPLSVQWQDLKDLLRPAGTIIRADVATDANGRPRGFGTALFVHEADAARAVAMFNDREVQGHRIRAHLERDSHVEQAHLTGPPYRNGVASSNLNFANSPPTNGSADPATSSGRRMDDSAPIDTAAESSATPGRSIESSPAAKLPWSLNTSLQHQTPGRPGPGPGIGPTPQTPGLHQHTPNFRQLHHPGPISMPPFPSLHDNPLSPLQTRGVAPMTPSMPGFVFNAPVYPETPPIHHGFMSNMGPFSPGIPVTSPNAFGYNPFSAPGAPVRYPQQPHQGSSALGTPTTQSFPMFNAHQAGYGGAGGNNGQQGGIIQTLQSNPNQDYFPPTGNGHGFSAPDTPTPKLNNSNRLPPGNNPLNAKQRLASADIQEKSLIDSTSNLALNVNMSENGNSKKGNETPESPSELRRTHSGTTSTDNGASTIGLLPGNEIKPRSSLDERRINLDPTLLVSGTDRRASFGDSR
ncbi:uncharacterized protein IL334_000445 [Kwoniella shivajii]|uniref:RRM domain-containing protein n=1 Tax=Kwoniella shivajii TaxID=564305 RepID=A0ABZ1CPI8_9TREE|nr:hypothetical protein IL334_000445 [Kwoniella shivajii]